MMQCDSRHQEADMYVIREILNCKPGRVRDMIKKFEVISTALEEMGHEPLRVLTDVAGEPFWTLVAEAKVETIEGFLDIETKLSVNDKVARAMGDYHELVSAGRREIYRIER
jgi:hypothetical protein